MTQRKPRRRLYAEDKLASLVFEDGNGWHYFRVEGAGFDFNWPFDEKLDYVVIDPENDECIGIRSWHTFLIGPTPPDTPVPFRVYLLRPLLKDVETLEERSARHQQQQEDDEQVGIPLTFEAVKDEVAVYLVDKSESRDWLEKPLASERPDYEPHVRLTFQGGRASLMFNYRNDVGAIVEYLNAELQFDPNDVKAKRLLRLLSAINS